MNLALEPAGPAAQADIVSIVATCHCLLDAQRNAEAASLVATALVGHAEDLGLLILQGRMLVLAGRAQEAIGTLSLVVTVQPANAAAHAGLADALAAHGEAGRAVQHSMVAFGLAPDAASASNFSAKLILAGHFEEARTVADYALRRHPDHFGALVNRATVLDALGDLEAAAATGERAVAVAPDNVTGRLMLAGLYLRMGQMTARAWEFYESRHRRVPPWMRGPVWAGEDLTGRTIVLHAEQGFGDTLQFVRYAPLVARRAGRVILAVQRPLLRLLRSVPGVDWVVATDETLPPFDFVCPLLSLPRLFATTLDTIPPPLPYADAFPAAPDAPGVLRVGLVWAGNPEFPLDAQRSLPAAALPALAGIPHVQFYSLQMPSARPPGLDLVDLMEDVRDFADTAARLAGLDLVIAVDTAVAHLAATMGKPVWLLSRFRGCWRWLHDRADSPWYPTMRIMRQTRLHDWSGVLADVKRDLERCVCEITSEPIRPREPR